MGNTNELSHKRLQILDCIINFSKENGFPPTVRELCKLVGLNSSSTVHRHLNKLEQSGYIKRHPTKPRAISVTDKYLPDTN